jgi:hypothetical protein
MIACPLRITQNVSLGFNNVLCTPCMDIHLTLSCACCQYRLFASEGDVHVSGWLVFVKLLLTYELQIWRTYCVGF